MAQQVTTDAFVDAFHSISSKADIELFVNRSAKLLYRYIRKAHKNDQAALLKTAEDINSLDDNKKKKYMDMLGRLSPDERYIVPLFCWQRFFLKRIAKTINLPLFITKGRLYAALNKVAKVILSIAFT